MTWLNRVFRFLFVVFMCACLFSFLARVMDDSDMRWTTGAAVWGAAVALAVVDGYFRSREKLKD